MTDNDGPIERLAWKLACDDDRQREARGRDTPTWEAYVHRATRYLNTAYPIGTVEIINDVVGDRLYNVLAFFDIRDGTDVADLVRSAREGWERSAFSMREEGAWEEFDALWKKRPSKASSEKRYTLDEARSELSRRACGMVGHEWEIIEASHIGPVQLICGRCGDSRDVAQEAATVSAPQPMESRAGIVPPRNPKKPHVYPGSPGHDLKDPGDCYTSDCSNGCGCWAGPSRSGGPDGIDPFGECPNG